MEVETESPVIPDEEEIRQRILREREAAEAERVARDKEMEEESARLDKLIEQEIRGVLPFYGFKSYAQFDALSQR